MIRVLILMESAADRRVWDEVIPLLIERGVQPAVGSVFGTGPLQAHIRQLGCDSFALSAETSRGYPAAAIRLSQRIRASNIDVVQGTEPIPGVVTGMAGLLAGRRALRVYHRQHTAFSHGSRLTTLSRWAARLSDVVLACSQSCAKAAHAIDGASARRIRLAHNAANELRPAESDEIADIRTRLGIPEEAHVISVVARLREVKGIDVLLAALPLLRSSLARDVHVIIAGSGPEEQRLRQRASSDAEHAHQIHFVGPKTEVAPWFSVADVVAMPSRGEGLPAAALEAMACGKPLVASAVDGLMEAIEDGQTGLLVPPDDPERLAAAIGQVLVDPSRAAAMGRAGRQRFENRYTNAHMVDAWIKCYEEFLSPNRPDAGRRG